MIYHANACRFDGLMWLWRGPGGKFVQLEDGDLISPPLGQAMAAFDRLRNGRACAYVFECWTGPTDDSLTMRLRTSAHDLKFELARRVDLFALRDAVEPDAMLDVVLASILDGIEYSVDTFHRTVRIREAGQ